MNIPKIQFALCHISGDSIQRGNTRHLRGPKYLCRKCTWNVGLSFGVRFAELFAKERLQCRWCPLNRIDISTNAVTNTGGFLRRERLNFHLSVEGKINQTISCNKKSFYNSAIFVWVSTSISMRTQSWCAWKSGIKFRAIAVFHEVEWRHQNLTVLYTFLKVLKRRSCLKIKSFFGWWSFSLVVWT